MNIRAVGAEFFHAEGRTDRERHTHMHIQTDMTEANSRFSQVCERA